MGTVGAVGTRVPPVKVTLRLGLGFSSLHLGFRRCPAWGRSGWGPIPTWSWPVGIGASLGGTRGLGALEDFSALHTLWEGKVALGWVSKPTCVRVSRKPECVTATRLGLACLTPCPGPALCWGLGHSARELPAHGAGTHGCQCDAVRPRAERTAERWAVVGPAPASRVNSDRGVKPAASTLTQRSEDTNRGFN